MANAGKRKECQKGSGGESKHEYDERASPHADDDIEPAASLNNVLRTKKESEDKNSDFGLKSLIQELDKDEEIGEKVSKDLADIANKVWPNTNTFQKFKTKMKTHRTVLTYS